MISSWWRNLRKWLGGDRQAVGRRGKGRAGRHSKCRPMLEEFEDRIVPTALSMPTNLTASRGSIVSVPIDVDTLNGPANANSGLSGGDFVVFYDTSAFSVSASDFSLGTISTNGSTAAGSGYSPSTPNGWTIDSNLQTSGEIFIGLSNSASGIITSTGSGSLVIINFHVKNGAALGASHINLAADDFPGPFITIMDDQNFSGYA